MKNDRRKTWKKWGNKVYKFTKTGKKYKLIHIYTHTQSVT